MKIFDANNNKIVYKADIMDYDFVLGRYSGLIFVMAL